MVIVELTRWPTATRGAIGRVAEVLGDIDAPGVDTEIIIRKYGIPDAHSPEAIAEAIRLGAAVSEKDIRGRTDFRDVPTVTIDGEHARDFDDAITIEKLANGHFWLGVHIADVSHYVQEGSALDREAYERGTSVYFPERAVHMFPSELATGLCSLNPHVDRLVQSCLMEIDRHGQVVRSEFHDGVINSNERMTYTEVNGILTDRDPALLKRYAPLVPMFEMMRRAVPHPERRPRRRGSIDFDLKEAGVDHRRRRRRRGDHRARAQRRAPADRGVHAARQRDRRDLSRGAGRAGALPHPRGARHPQGREVRRVHLRLRLQPRRAAQRAAAAALPEADRANPWQARGEADRVPDAADDAEGAIRARRTSATSAWRRRSYTHFTSPIRRYPDLVVHRALRAARHGLLTEGAREEWTEDLPEVARHTSEMERRADDAERELLQWKKVKFMADKVGDEFEGYITGVAAFGLFIELIEHYVEGMVHVSTMADDYYRFLEARHMLRGENTNKSYRLGDKVRVQVLRVNMDERQIDLGLADILERVREGERGSRAQQGGAEGRQAQAAPRPQRKAEVQEQKAEVKSIVVGTAGHIDHGKSALVRALTGIDPIG